MSDVLLTISLLCSGRKDTTELTLKGLMSIKSKIPSEIIVVDTGCDDELREVIKKYADQIIPFKWIDDFAAARNVGVDAASGEWFMFIDDDEWFEDTSDIEDFFLSGRYKNYVTAAYQVESYMNEERTITVKDWTLRLFSLADGNRFWGMIHEYPKNELGERCYLLDIAKHTGYKFESPEKAREHSYRNIRPLQKMMEIDPENVKWVYQLVQEYRAIGNFPAMRDLCLEAADAIIDLEGAVPSVYRATFYVGVILAEEEMHDKKAAREHYKLFSADSRNNIFGQAMLYNIGTMQALEDERFEEAIFDAKCYYAIYDKFHDDDVLQADGAGFFVRDAMWTETCNGVLQAQMIAMMRLNQTNGLNEVYDLMDDTTAQLIGEYKLALNAIDALGEHPEDEELIRIFTRLCNDSRINVSIEGGLYALHRTHRDWFDNIAAIADKIDSEYFFLKYLKVYHAKKIGDMALLSQSIADIDTVKFIYGIDVLMGSTSLETFSEMAELGESLGLPKNRSSYVAMRLAEKTMASKNASDFDSFENLLEEMGMWAASTIEFYELYFSPYAFEGDLEMLPANAQVAIYLSRFMDVMTEDFRAGFSILKKTVAIWPVTKPYVNRLSQLYGDFVKVSF